MAVIGSPWLRSSIGKPLLVLMTATAVALGQAGAAPPRLPAAVASMRLTCPAGLATVQSAPSIPGWQSYHPSGDNRLAGYGFYTGPVVENAELAPADERRSGRITTTTWRFEGDSKPTYFACTYHGTSIVLSRPLPANIRQCTIKSDDMRPAAGDDLVTCR